MGWLFYLVVIEVALLLLPSTLLYVGVMLFAIFGFYGANSDGITPAFLIIIAFLLLPGYGFYSLWWLVMKYQKISFDQIPVTVWMGLIIGGVISLLCVAPFLVTGFLQQIFFISLKDNLPVMLPVGIGPLIVTITLLVILRQKRAQS